MKILTGNSNKQLSNKISKNRKLVTFAKAYSGLNNSELMELDKWIRSHTIERYGPTRVVEQKQVFEIAFEQQALVPYDPRPPQSLVSWLHVVRPVSCVADSSKCQIRVKGRQD